MSMTRSRHRRSPEEWRDLAQEMLPLLQTGEPLSEVASRFDVGTHIDAIRTELARLGYDSRGEPMQLKAMTVKRPAAKAKAIAARRRAGAPWWLVIAESGMSYGELNRTLTEHGFDARGNPLTTDGRA